MIYSVLVPGLLEFESIPAVSSSKPFGRTNMRQRNRNRSEDVTVKTITKYVSPTFTITKRKYFTFYKVFFSSSVILCIGNFEFSLC